MKGLLRARSPGMKNFLPELSFSCPLLPPVRVVFSPQWTGRADQFPPLGPLPWGRKSARQYEIFFFFFEKTKIQEKAGAVVFELAVAPATN